MLGVRLAAAELSKASWCPEGKPACLETCGADFTSLVSSASDRCLLAETLLSVHRGSVPQLAPLPQTVACYPKEGSLAQH